MRTKGPLVRVIAFHDVGDKKWFSDVLAMLNQNFNVITPAQFNAKEFDSKKINILLTFDDGYQSWIKNCVPILEAYNFKGLFFINSGLLDSAQDTEVVATYMTERLLISPKMPLTWEGAKMLAVQGHSIGGHTVTHPNLATKNREEQSTEITNDKRRIEEMLGTRIQDFAYPFGTKNHISSEAVTEVANAGYQNQYSAVSNFSTLKNQRVIPRTLIEKQQKSTGIKKWIEGGYDMFNLIK